MKQMDVREWLGHNLPPSLGRIPYGLTLSILRRRFQSNGQVQIWARNSYVLGGFYPALSDLDLTFYFEQEASPECLVQVRKRLEIYRKIFKWLAEINAWAELDLPFIQKSMNPLELARDPVLLGLTNGREATPAERAVFLLRMLEADFQRLSRRPDLRLAKWRKHMAAAGRDFIAWSSQNPIEFILNEICLISEIDPASISIVLSAIKKLQEGIPAHKVAEESVSRKFLIALLPNRFCFLSDLVSLDSNESALMLAQAEWEALGILSQSRLNPNAGHIPHLERMRSLAGRVAPASAVRLRVQSALDRTLEICRRFK